MDIRSEITQRRADILQRIRNAAQTAGRSKDHVTLTAVSKMQPDERVDAMLAAGQRVFGENRVQEAQTRWADRRKAFDDIELRLIGPLQSNKAGDAVALFDVIETLDRDSLARALRKEMDRQDRRPSLYVQVNTGEEDQKSGVAPREAVAFVRRMESDYAFTIDGLMCIPPVGEPAGPHFALLADLASACGVTQLSMGMSSDFETAIRFGATSVRVGSALFGARG